MKNTNEEYYWLNHVIVEPPKIIVYHGTTCTKLIDNSLDPKSYVSTDLWCAESYGPIIYKFECAMEDLVPDYYGLPPGVETNIFRIKHRFYPLTEEI